MVQSYPITAGIQLVTALVSAGLGVVAFRSRAQRSSPAFGAMMLGAVGWSLGSGLSSLLAGPTLTYALGSSVYPFTLLTSVGWLYIAGRFTERKLLSTRPVVVGFGVVLVGEVLILATNQSHHLFLKGPATVPASGVIEPVPGPLYWLHMTVTTGMLLLGLLFLVVELRAAKGVYAEQTKAIIGGGLFPMLFSLVEVFDIVSVPGLDMGVVGLTVGLCILFFALRDTDLLDVVPVKRDALIENMDQAVVALDEDERIVDLNPEAMATFDVSESDIGVPVTDAFDAVPALVAEMESPTDATSEVVVDRGDETRHYSITVSSVTDGDSVRSQWLSADSVGKVVVVRDITVRRRRERRLQQYRTVVETAGDPIFVLDEEGSIELLNGAMSDFLDQPHEELLDEHIGEFLEPKNRNKITEALAHMAVVGGEQHFKMDRDAPDGTTRSYEVNMQLIQSETGAVGSVGVVRDVTEHENRKREFDLLGQVLTRVLRHNIRNDITVIRGQAEVIAETLDGQEAESAEKIRTKSNDLIALAKNAREAKRIIKQTNDRVLLDLETAVDDALDTIERNYPDATVYKYVCGCQVRAHEKIQLAIRNLVENAIVHNDSDDPTVDIRTSVDGAGVTLSIADDGPGIHEDELDVLESHRETALSHGRGLGLWVVTWLVERSNADISFSTTDAGTEVTITFEQATESSAESVRTEPPPDET